MMDIKYDDNDVETTFIVMLQSICRTMNTWKNVELDKG